MINREDEKKIRERLKWLEQKLIAQQTVGGPDHTASPLFRGRTQGEIGGMKWILREIGGLRVE